jgi:5-methylcytosine-specific restriction endonuclease McrA
MADSLGGANDMNDHTTQQMPHETPFGYCKCGCGKKTAIASNTDAKRGWKKGEPKPFYGRHSRRGAGFMPSEGYPLWVSRNGLRYPYGKCQCGCGQETTIAAHTNVRRGNIEGYPTQFVDGHGDPHTGRQYKSGEEHPNWKTKLIFACKMCGNEFKLPEWRTKGKERTNDFCSIKCRSEYKAKYLSGANAPDYVGGIKTYRGKGWIEARSSIVDLQNGNCAICGKHIGSKLSVHHIRPFREFNSVAEANELSNLVGLCQSCHMHVEHPKKIK